MHVFKAELLFLGKSSTGFSEVVTLVFDLQIPTVSEKTANKKLLKSAGAN